MAEQGDQLLEQLMRFKPEGLTPNAWAVQAGVGRTIWADLRRHGNPSRRTLSKLLEAAGSSLAEFEALRVGKLPQAPEQADVLAESGRGWGQAPLTPLPLLSTQPGERWGEIDLIALDHGKVIESLPRPPSLTGDRDAYAVTIVSESMWPRFRKGGRIAVSPAAPAHTGDDVLVMLGDGRGALIGELRSRSTKAVSLRQYNPPMEFEVAAADLEAVHKVLGELI